MSAPLFSAEREGRLVSVLTTPLYGGCWLLCVQTPDHDIVRAIPYKDVAAGTIRAFAELLAGIVGAMA